MFCYFQKLKLKFETYGKLLKIVKKILEEFQNVEQVEIYTNA